MGMTADSMIWKGMVHEMVKKVRLMGIMVALMAALSLTACGGGNDTVDEPSTEYDEDGNPVVKEEISTLLLPDSEIMSSGILAVMEDGSITSNGIQISESGVGGIADRYRMGEYKYEEGKFKKNEVEYVAVFYDINGESVSAMYFDGNMDMCYDNKYMIHDPVMRGIFMELKDTIRKDSVVLPDGGGKGQQDSSGGDTQDVNNNTMSLSRQAFSEAGFASEDADALARTTFNLGIPVVKTAVREANTVLFSDVDGTEYTLSMDGGRIVSVYDETNGIYLYEIK